MKDYYSLLGIRGNASESEIRSAYRRMAKRIHPDLHPNDSQAEKRQRQRDFVYLPQAYETLSNPDKCAAYDRKLRAHRMRSAAQKDQKPSASTSSYSREHGYSPRPDAEKRSPRSAAPETDLALDELLEEMESLLQRFGLGFKDPLNMLADWARKVFRETVEMWENAGETATETPNSDRSTTRQQQSRYGEPLDGIEEELLNLKNNSAKFRKTGRTRKAQSNTMPTDKEIEIEMQRLKRKYKRL